MVKISLNGKYLMDLPKACLKLEDKVMWFNHGNLDIAFTASTTGEITFQDLNYLKSLRIDIEDLIPYVRQQVPLQLPLFADNSEMIT